MFTQIHPVLDRPIPAMIEALNGVIGNTPLIEINLNYKGEGRKIYAKLEYFNLSGSIKDRMALEILKCAYRKGAIQPQDMIVEATSGNAGIAFSALGRALRHPVRIYKDEGGFIGSIEKAEDLARTRNDIFLPRQFSNPDNCNAHCQMTGPEILNRMQKHGKDIDAFIAGVGTGGTVMGVGRALKAVNANTRIHPLEPSESPTLSTGYKVGRHRIQGVSDEFIPDIICLKSLDEVVCVNDGDAILMAQTLSAKLGLGVGISSGANLIGALKVQNEQGADKAVVTVFCDDNKKYLSTDLTKVEPIKSGYLSPDVELIDYKVL